MVRLNEYKELTWPGQDLTQVTRPPSNCDSIRKSEPYHQDECLNSTRHRASCQRKALIVLGQSKAQTDPCRAMSKICAVKLVGIVSMLPEVHIQSRWREIEVEWK